MSIQRSDSAPRPMVFEHTTLGQRVLFGSGKAAEHLAAELDRLHPDLTVKMRQEAGIYSQEDVFTVAGARAIRDGADMAQVVNARRGMTTAQVGAERILATKAGATRGRVRLMPETIMQIAGSDRPEAIRLLRLHGYLRD